MNDYNQNAQYNANQHPIYQGQHTEANNWPHMTMGNWIVTLLLMLIPVANIVLMFVWAFSSNVNPSKKAFFKASLIMAAISIGLSILLGGILTSILVSLVNTLA